jgi:mono/diheme cytochrome c family protein
VIRAVAAALFAVALPAQAADVERGRALYEGRIVLPVAAAAPMSAACSACHRPSGMGNFEGGLAVPPIAGPTLFKPLDRDTGRFFAASSRWRVRPAYDEASLGQLLRKGISPDGVTMGTAMPRYALADADLVDLTAYLRQLSEAPPPGLEAGMVRVATITTPDADPTRRDAMLATLQHFIAQKNGQSRHEAQRSVQSSRTREMVMYRKFRVWQLEHWALQGEPSTWGAQLDEWQSRQPVYAVVAGMGGAEWAPVDAFCARRRLPCLLPIVETGAGGAPGFYSLHFHAGIEADASLAVRRLKAQGVHRVALWGNAAGLAERVRGVLLREGITIDADAPVVVSLLAPAAHAARLREFVAREAVTVVWLPGTHALGRAQLDAALPLTARGWIVTPMRTGELLDRQLKRTRLWLHGQGLDALPTDVAASTLQAVTVLGEGLVHVDFGFTPEYLLELLEHGLENVIPWSPYPRLAIGPDQRIASKGSWVGEVREGRVDWQWAASP